MRLFVAPRVLRVPTLRTQSGPLLGSLLPCPGPLCPRPESSQLPPVLGGPQTHPSSQGPSPTHTGPAGDAQPRTGAQRPLVRPSARAPQEWEGVRPRVEGTREGEGLAAGCRDWVRAGKALPFLRADFQDHLGPRGTEEDKKSGGTEVNSLFPGWTFSSAHQISWGGSCRGSCRPLSPLPPPHPSQKAPGGKMSRHLFRALENDSARFEEKLHGLTPVAEGRWPLGPAPRLHSKDAGSSSYQSGPSGTSNELLYHIWPVISCKSSKFLFFFLDYIYF